MLSAEQDFLFDGTGNVGSYVDLVIAKSLLHLIKQAAVSELTEGCQVIIGCWRHKFDLKKIQSRVKRNIQSPTSAASEIITVHDAVLNSWTFSLKWKPSRN